MFGFLGLVYDLTGDFNASFYLASFYGFLASCLGIIVLVRQQCFIVKKQMADLTPKLEAQMDFLSDDAASQSFWSSMVIQGQSQTSHTESSKKRSTTI